MKNPIFYLLVSILVVSISSCATRTVVVRQPSPVVTVRPAAPSPQHIWAHINLVGTTQKVCLI